MFKLSRKSLIAFSLAGALSLGGLFAENVTGLTVSSPTEILPPTIVADVTQTTTGEGTAYGIYDKVGLAGGVPAGVSIVATGYRNDAIGIYITSVASAVGDIGATIRSHTDWVTYSSATAHGLLTEASIGNFTGTITVSTGNYSQAYGVVAEGHRTAAGSISMGNIGGEIHVQSQQGIGVALYNEVYAQNMTGLIAVTASNGAYGIVLQESSVQAVQSQIKVSSSDLLAVGINLSGESSYIGEISSTANVTVDGLLAVGIAFSTESGDHLGTVAGSIVATATGTGTDSVAVAYMFQDGSGRSAETENTLYLADGATLKAVNNASTKRAMAFSSYPTDTVSIQIQGDGGTFYITGGASVGKGITLSGGTYEWDNLCTLKEGTVIAMWPEDEAMLAVATQITVGSDAVLKLGTSASLEEGNLNVLGEVVLSANTLTEFTAISLDEGAKLTGDGRVTLVLSEGFVADAGQTMQLIELLNGASISGTALDNFKILLADGQELALSEYTLDTLTGLLTFNGNIPEAAHAAALLSLLALGLVARRR